MINYFYNPYMDVAVCIISIAIIFMLTLTYTKKNFYFKLLFIAIINIFFASITSAYYNSLLADIEKHNKFLIYSAHDIFYTLLISIWVLFIIYIYSLSIGLKNKKKVKRFIFLLSSVLFSYVIVEQLSDITRFGFYIEDNIAYEHFLINPFMLYYTTLGSTCLAYFLKNKKLFPKKIFINIVFLFIYCVAIMIKQGIYHTTTFNTMTFFLPILVIFYLLHSNGYDSETGALGPDVFYDYINEHIKKKESFTIITLKLYDNNVGADSEMDISSILNKICRFCDFQYKQALLFQKNKYLINIITKNTNKRENVDTTLKLKEYIESNFKDYNLKIKYTILRYSDELEMYDAKEIIDLNKYIINRTKVNTIYEHTQNDIDEFKKQHYIKEQLLDIVSKEDMEDPRILVYCQPIMNSNNSYKNAEVLMRLELPSTGIVFPNDFIPIAEKHKIIHTLSLIILNKSCKEIKKLMNEGYDIDRFSINFSANEFNMSSFYDEVTSIISNNNVPYDKIAFEVTETTFNKIDNLNKIMNQLKEIGIVFYLDDFGTGYSNMDRITELPFSTIKFDRSLVISSSQKDNSKFIVNSLCDIFNKLNFNLLFEGIENNHDEEMCVEMGANYLQGYKYSKPIPIEDVRKFLDKK